MQVEAGKWSCFLLLLLVNYDAIRAVILFLVIIENTIVFSRIQYLTRMVWNIYNYCFFSNFKLTSISNLTLHRKLQRVFFTCFWPFFFTRTTHPNSVIEMVIRNSLEVCTTICYLFIWSLMISSLVVSGASGIVWPESRNITQDLGWGLNRPLWAVIGWTHQKEQSGQAQNCCCRHPQHRGVSLLCSYEMYLRVPTQIVMVF